MEGMDTFETPFHAFYWAIVTMTTVGFGDIYPHSIYGKWATLIVILAGVAITSVFTATVSSVFVATKIREGKGLQEVYYKDHLIISGWCPGAEKIVEALKALAKDPIRIVFVNDLPSAQMEELLLRFKELKPKFVRGDFSHATILKRAGINKATSVILLPDMNAGATSSQVDQKTTLAALTVKDVNSNIRVYAYALDEDSVPHLRRAGVDRVVLRDAYHGYLLACHALEPGIPEVVDELMQFDRGHRFARIRFPEHLVGKTIREASQWVLEEYSGMLIGIIHEEKVINVEDILTDDFSSIDAFIMRKFAEAGRSADELAQKRVQINPEQDVVIEPDMYAVIIQRVSQSAKQSSEA